MSASPRIAPSSRNGTKCFFYYLPRLGKAGGGIIQIDHQKVKITADSSKRARMG
jgi:hypothetical protein